MESGACPYALRKTTTLRCVGVDGAENVWPDAGKVQVGIWMHFLTGRDQQKWWWAVVTQPKHLYLNLHTLLPKYIYIYTDAKYTVCTVYLKGIYIYIDIVIECVHIYNIHTYLHARQSIVQVFSKHVFLHSLHYKRIVQNRLVHPNQPSNVGCIQGFHHGSDAWRKAAEKTSARFTWKPIRDEIVLWPPLKFGEIWGNLGKFGEIIVVFFCVSWVFPAHGWPPGLSWRPSHERWHGCSHGRLNFDSKIGGGTVSLHLPRIIAG